MGSIKQHCGLDADVIFAAAIKQAAETLVDLTLYTATGAIDQFGLTISDMKKIDPTQLPGRQKPKYSAKNIKIYINRHTRKAKTRSRN